MYKNPKIYFVTVFLVFTNLKVLYSQINYSKFMLTGRDDVNLVGEDFKLQKETFEAFNKMREDALKDSILIQVASAFRSFERQKKIWNRKYQSYILEGLLPQKSINKIIEYSTIPGTSRHHWGTDIDIVDGLVVAPKELLVARNYMEGGVYEKLKKWMDANSEKYGFYLVYDDNPSRKGFKYEPWHFSFKPVSNPMLNEFLKLDLVELLKENNVSGSQFFTSRFLKKYYARNILDINPKLN